MSFMLYSGLVFHLLGVGGELVGAKGGWVGRRWEEEKGGGEGTDGWMEME